MDFLQGKTKMFIASKDGVNKEGSGAEAPADLRVCCWQQCHVLALSLKDLYSRPQIRRGLGCSA